MIIPIEKTNKRKLYQTNRESYSTNNISKISKIYDEKINVLILKRELNNKFFDIAKKIFIKKPNLKFSKVLSPYEVEESLINAIGFEKKLFPIFEDIFFLSSIFSDLFDVKKIWLRINTINHPMCPRFHVDNVKCRLVSTYFGPGMQWLPNNSVNRSKLGLINHGIDDEKSGVFESKNDIKQLDLGDVAFLKGDAWSGNAGLGAVHRSPHSQKNYKRMYVRIDFSDIKLNRRYFND